MKLTNGDEISTQINHCSCNSTNGCEKCRPKLSVNNYYKIYIPSEFEKFRIDNNFKICYKI